MKKIYILSAILSAFSLSAQFSVSLQGPADFKNQEAILYTLNGSKDIIFSKELGKNNTWAFKYPTKYVGMMKIYFPSSNNVINFISENKNVDIKFDVQSDKIKNVTYKDEVNDLMSKLQESSQKKQIILPTLSEIKEYYKDDTDFSKALVKEIDRISGSKDEVDQEKHPFIYYYKTNSVKFLSNDKTSQPNQDEMINFVDKSNDLLESSSLLRPLLATYLTVGGNENISGSVDKLLGRLNVETPRGQTVLSEIIDIFDIYGMKDLKNKYLAQAKGLKCTINDRLASTLKSNTIVEVGSTFPDYQFQKPINTTAHSLYGVKADKKVIVFWSSVCSHCENELPQLLEKYNELTKQKVQVVGFSLDTDKNSYDNRITAFPWINDSELRGWNSSYVENFNVHATPTYFILDANNKIISRPEHVGDVLEYFKLK